MYPRFQLYISSPDPKIRYIGIKSELMYVGNLQSPDPIQNLLLGEVNRKLENGPDPVYEYILGWKDGIGRPPADRLLIYLKF